MIACLDVQYSNTSGVAACVVASNWYASQALNVYATTIHNIAPFEAGAFYKRELPCLLQVLNLVQEALDFIVVDSYVWLDNQREKKGLGAYLYEALDCKIPIIGVAKTKFEGADNITELVYRGNSQNPLYVTSIGVELDWAAQQIYMMHGDYRLPTLLKEADTLCRSF